jgi:hypothetical protein
LPSDQIWDAVEADYIIFDSTQREDMLPETLFESPYFYTRGFRPITVLHQERGIIIVYQRQTP